MPRPTAIQAANNFRQKLANQESASAERMATVYNRLYQNLSREAQGLADQLAAMDEVSQGKVMKLARIRSLLAQVKDEITKFGGTAQNEITIVQSQAIEAGLSDALRLMEASLPPLPPDGTRTITRSFTRLHRDAIEAAAGLMGSDSPLKQSLEAQFGEYVAGQVETHFLDGIGAGMRADRITALLNRNLQNGLGEGLTSVLRALRTAQIKSYQIANHATYLANSNIVSGWIWWADLGGACLSCIEQHGTVHPLDETLDDHHNGRCAPIPQTVSYADLGLDIPEEAPIIETGPEWFDKQPDSRQREIMGGAMYDAYKAGQVGFGDFSAKYDDPVYGTLLREASLRDILGERANDYYKKEG